MSSAEPSRTRRRPVGRRRAIVIVAAASVIAVVIGVAFALAQPERPQEGRAASVSPTPTTTPSSSAIEGSPENTEVYDLAALPVVDVFAVTPALMVDDAPLTAPLPFVATPKAPGAPLFADPSSDPVGVLPSVLEFDGTTVPVLERQTNWARIMLAGRAGLPSQGVSGQLTAWVRTNDIDIAPSAITVLVSLSSPTIEILDGDDVVYETAETAVGAPETPTPVGRTFIMTTRVDPQAGYTRGKPIVYLGLQSPTLDGFNGQNNAITAFHYHDERRGPISNGCLRVDEASIDRLAALPLGTAVLITA